MVSPRGIVGQAAWLLVVLIVSIAVIIFMTVKRERLSNEWKEHANVFFVAIAVYLAGVVIEAVVAPVRDLLFAYASNASDGGEMYLTPVMSIVGSAVSAFIQAAFIVLVARAWKKRTKPATATYPALLFFLGVIQVIVCALPLSTLFPALHPLIMRFLGNIFFIVMYARLALVILRSEPKPGNGLALLWIPLLVIAGLLLFRIAGTSILPMLSFGAVGTLMTVAELAILLIILYAEFLKGEEKSNDSVYPPLMQ